METRLGLARHCHTRCYTSLLLSPSSPVSPPPTNLHRRRHHHVQGRPDSTMPLRSGPTLRRITANQYNFRFNRPTKAFYISNPHIMAEEFKNKDVESEMAEPTTSSIGKSNEEKEKKSTPSVPPPPEKPLPGDCCGSGCVRCVWDVYYEELEEYDRLYKPDSKTSRN